MSEYAKTGLRDLRSCIFEALEGETSVRMDIYVRGENCGLPFKFKIGSGSEHMNINVDQNGCRCEFQRGFFSKVWNFTKKAFKYLLQTAASAAVGYLATKAIGWSF